MKETTPSQERRQRRNAENRETILHAAEAVILRRGFSESTMDDVAREADFSKATVYKYFPAKSDLVLSILIHFMEDIERILDDILASRPDPSEGLRRMLRATLEFHEKKENIARVILLDSSMSKVMRLFMSEGTRPEGAAEREFLGLLKAARRRLHDKAGTLVAAGIRSGVFRAVRIPDLMAYIDAVIQGFGHQKYWMERRLSPAGTADLIHDFLLRGIGAPSKRAGKE
jgi:AcrR family transcriptional regulator